MTTELVLTETVPALANYELTAEMEQQLEDLVFLMTTPPMGLENTNWEWRPDIVKIKAPTTTDDACPGNAEIGDIWAAGEILWSRKEDGKDEPFRFIPIYHWKQHSKFVYGKRQPDCSSPDGVTAYDGTPCVKCPHLPWKGSAKVRPGSDKTECDETFSFLVMAEDMSNFYVLNFRGTSAKAGKNILRNTRRALWGKVYGLTSVEQSTDTNTWQKYDVAPISGSRPAPAVQAFARFVHEQKDQAAKAQSAELNAAREAIEKTLNADLEEGGAIDDLEAELNADDGFSESM